MKRVVLFVAALIAVVASAMAAKPLEKYQSTVSHFAWGVEAGAAIDMTSNDLSTMNLGAFFGYRNSWLDMLGVGASINMMVEDSNRSFPIYAMFRTNFRRIPTACFLDVRGGIVYNNMNGSNQTRFYASPGVGFNLARGRAFQSYITLSYLFNDMQPFVSNQGRTVDIHGLHMAVLRLGIAF